MSIQEVRAIIERTYDVALPRKFASQSATVLLLAVSGIEANWTARAQVGGPAHGLWQFEKGGGVRGVLAHPASAAVARAVCQHQGVEPTERAVYDALVTDDVLACAFARLLLYTDPAPLPVPGQMRQSWDYYERNWRPGKPHPEKWPWVYQQAIGASA